MPLQSEAQRKYLWANDPELARKFEAETPKGAKLPARKRKTEHVADETEVVELKDFSDKERAKLAKKHEAMPGGGFPIRNGADLRNAIQAVGRAKNPAAARAWIIKRAKELKLTDALPGGWELAARIDALELAVLALGNEDFVGDLPGHPFRGNQYSDISGKGARENAEADRRTVEALTPRFKRPGESDRSFAKRQKEAAVRNQRLTGGSRDSIRDLSGNKKAPSDVVALHQHTADKSSTDSMPSSSKAGGTLGFPNKEGVSATAAGSTLSSTPQGIDVHTYPSGVEIHNDYNGFQTGVDRLSYQDAAKTADALRSAKADDNGVTVSYDHNGYQSSVQRYTADQATKLADKLEQAAKGRR